MKPRVSPAAVLALIVSLVASATQASAQGAGEQASSDWSRVKALRPGTVMDVYTRAAPDRQARWFVHADDTGVMWLDLTIQGLSLDARRTLIDIAANHPDYYSRIQAGERFTTNDIRLGRDGLEVHGAPVLGLSQFLEVVTKEEVTGIRAKLRVRGSVGATLAGVGAGIGVTVLLYFLLADHKCGNSCGVEQLAILAPPAAGGVLGYFTGRRSVDTLIYQAQ